ncbi:MAG: arginine deiminase family protein [Bacillota bacterium]
MSLKDTAQYYHIVLERISPRAEPAFEDPEMQQRVWGRRWGVHNDVGRLRMVLVHRPGDEVRVMSEDHYDPSIEALIDDREQWYFRSDCGPDLDRMQREHDSMVEVLKERGVQVEYVDCSRRDPKAVFVRDCAIAVRGGAVICRMGPVGEDFGTGRRGEERYVTQKLVEMGMPILRTIHGTGLLEGGSFCFLDEKHAAVGTSYRQNSVAVDQLRNVLHHQGVELIEVPLVGHSLHIDGAIVMIDHDRALVDVTRLPYWFLDTLRDLGVQTVRVDPRDQEKTVNCLALAPARVLMCSGSDWTADALDKLGVEVTQIPYDEHHKNGGGIHCSTMPVIRDID